MTTAAPPQPHAGWTPGPIAAVSAGSVLGLVALALAVAGLVLTFAYAALRDDDGFFTTPTERLATPTAAITAEDMHIGGAGDADDWVVEELGGSVRISAALEGSAPIFVGIARERDLDAYLAGVAHDQLDRFDDNPTYDRSGAPLTNAPAPGAQDFWVAQATGSGEQTAEWNVRSGDWAAVVMRADGRRSLAADVNGGAKAGWVFAIGLALLGAAALLLAVAGALIWTGVRLAGGASAAAPAPLGVPEGAMHPQEAATEGTAVAAGRYPVRFDARLDEPLSPWLWLVKWVLAIPHVVVLAFLWIAVHVLTIVALFAILFTGRYPRSIFDFNVGVLRWTWRVNYYAFSAIATDRYPPFSLAAADYPCEIDVPYPTKLSRGLVLVKWWLLAIPHYLIVGAFIGGAWWWQTGVPGVLPVLVLVAGAVLLFTRRYPRDVFRLVVGINRWALRVAAYALLMRDEYPPFRLDD